MRGTTSSSGFSKKRTMPDVRGTYSLEAPVRVTGAQAWTVGANDTLKVKAPLRTAFFGTVTAGGSGTYSLEAGSPDFANLARLRQ